MFRWNHQQSMEIDLPLNETWKFFTNPTNWPIPDKRIEAFILDGDFKQGARIHIKTNSLSHHILITEVKPLYEYKTLFHNGIAKEEKLVSFEAITPNKTRMIIQSCVLSPFVPFMKKTLLKNASLGIEKMLEIVTKHLSTHYLD